jgi:hypothetical protein
VNNYLVWFYLNTPNPNSVWQYPTQAADAYSPDFNVTELSQFCEQNNTRFVVLYEYQANQYYNTTLTANTALTALTANQRFTLDATFGTSPNRIFVLTFR